MRDLDQSKGYERVGDERTLPGDATYLVRPGQPDRWLHLSLYPVRPGGAVMPRSKHPCWTCLFYAAGSIYYHLQQSWIAHLLLFEHIAHNHSPVLDVGLGLLLSIARSRVQALAFPIRLFRCQDR